MNTIRVTLYTCLLISTILAGVGCTTIEQNTSELRVDITNTQFVMKISSPAFVHNSSIPSHYTCDGENTNPPFEFSNIPKDAQSLVLIMNDPDVPKSIRKDGMWDHWIIWNIPPTTTTIGVHSEPEGMFGTTTSGTLTYVGPCPPDGEHRYFFKLYALDVLLNIQSGVSKLDVEKAMEGHILEQAELIGLYKRE